MRRLYRTRPRMIAGVCAGIADFFGIDPTLVRLGWVALSLFWGTGVIIYLAGWLIIPEY